MGIFFSSLGSVKLFGFIEELLDKGVFPLDDVDVDVALVGPALGCVMVLLNTFWLDLFKSVPDGLEVFEKYEVVLCRG